jgi:hypothetical protein
MAHAGRRRRASKSVRFKGGHDPLMVSPSTRVDLGVDRDVHETNVPHHSAPEARLRRRPSMELLVSQVMGVLVGYAADRGAKLAAEGGRAAIDVAERMLRKVIDRLKGDPAQATNAGGFEANPEGYKTPVEDALRVQVRQDPAFGDELAALLEALQKVAPGAVSLVVTGSGAAAAHGGVAAGQGGAAAGAGGSAWVGTPSPPPTTTNNEDQKGRPTAS